MHGRTTSACTVARWTWDGLSGLGSRSSASNKACAGTGPRTALSRSPLAARGRRLDEDQAVNRPAGNLPAPRAPDPSASRFLRLPLVAGGAPQRRQRRPSGLRLLRGEAILGYLHIERSPHQSLVLGPAGAAGLAGQFFPGNAKAGAGFQPSPAGRSCLAV